METREFGARLRELRKQAGFSQRGLANKIGVNFSYLSKIESGAMAPPSEKVILRLAEALNADKDELITLAGKIPADIVQILQNRETWQLLRSRRPQKKVKVSSKIRGAIPRNFKTFARVALAIILVASIGASLWFASPTPVRALEMSFPSLPATGTLGSIYTFTVKIDIASTELVPIQSIDLEIYNLASPIAYKATLTNLPLTATTKSYTSTQTGGGAVSVTATMSNWGWGYGYGYAVWQGTPQYFGYGYGYGLPEAVASVTYAVSWTSPSGWPSGAYKAKVSIIATSPVRSETFIETSGSFALSAEEVVPLVTPLVTPPVVVPPVVVPPVVVPPVVVPPVVVPPVVVPPVVVPPVVVPPVVVPPVVVPPVVVPPVPPTPEVIAAMPPATAAITVSQLPPATAATTVSQLPPTTAAAIFEAMSPTAAAAIVTVMPPVNAADVFKAMPAQAAADVVTVMPPVNAADVFKAMPAQDAANVATVMAPVDAADVFTVMPAQAAANVVTFIPATAAGAILENVPEQPAAQIMQVLPTPTLTEVIPAMSEKSLTERLPGLTTEKLYSVSPAVLFAALPNAPTEQLVGEDPPKPPAEATPPVTVFTTATGARYMAIKTWANEWVVVMHTPLPLEKLLIKTKRALGNVETTVEIMSAKPATITTSLPEEQVVRAYFDISFVNATPADIEAGHLTFKLEKDWMSQNSIHKWSVTLNKYDTKLGQWLSLPTKRVKEDDSFVYYTSVITDFSTFAISGSQTVPPPTYQVTNLAIEPSEAESGQPVTISVDITNLTDKPQTYALTLWINNTVETGQKVSVAAGQTAKVSFTSARQAEDSYQVRVDRLLGNFSVKAPLVKPVNWWLIGGIIAAIIIIGAAVWLVVRRRRA